MIHFDEKEPDVLKAYSMLIYFAGSFILNEPAESCIRDIESGNILRKMPVSSKNPNFILAQSFLNNINSDNPSSYDDILADHLSLFGNSGDAQAPPYESVYISPDHLMNQEPAREIRLFYNSYGWESSLNGRVPDDHLGIELQFLNLLIEKLYLEDDNICHKEIEKDIKKLLDNHFKPWVSEWNLDMQKNALSDFYKGIAYLVVACVQDIYYLV